MSREMARCPNCIARWFSMQVRFAAPLFIVGEPVTRHVLDRDQIRVRVA